MEQKKILLILTGGTIGSFQEASGKLGVDADMSVPLLMGDFKGSDSAFTDVGFDIVSPINTLSENMTFDKINALIYTLQTTDLSQYRGIMIAHGTDTVHVTAPLIALLTYGIHLPVFFVTSQRTLSDPMANGFDNFTKTVNCIMSPRFRCDDGAFMVYRNSDGVSYIHDALHLNPCPNYSDDFVDEGMMPYVDAINDRTGFDEAEAARPAVSREALLYEVRKIQPSVLLVLPYVGLDYSRLANDAAMKGVKTVLHNTYHSGTASSEEGIYGAKTLIQYCQEKEIPFYLAPVDPENYRYSSTKALIEAGAECLYGDNIYVSYAKLLISDAVED